MAGVTAKWQGGGRAVRDRRRSPCRAPSVLGGCESLLTGISHAGWGGGGKGDTICNKTACSAASSHLSKPSPETAEAQPRVSPWGDGEVLLHVKNT